MTDIATQYRPKWFNGVVGQSQQLIINIIRHSVDHPHPLYIFIGESGVGKTTVARIFARAIQCSAPINGEPCNECDSCKKSLANAHPDIKEYDMGQLRLVSDVDKIKDGLRYKPLMGKQRVLILNEYHMISSTAEESLLMTLEEPPKNTTFILTTTEGNKVKNTTLTRAQVHTFDTVDSSNIVYYLTTIGVEGLGKQYSEDVYDVIAESGKGSVRQAVKNFEKWIDSGLSKLAEAKEMFPVLPEGDLISLAKLIVSRQNRDKAEKLAYQMMSESKLTSYEMVVGLMENFADYLHKNTSIQQSVINDMVYMRQLCLLELGYLKNCGYKWHPFRDFMFHLYNRQVSSGGKSKEELPKETVDLAKKIGKSIDALPSVKSDCIELKLVVSGKIIFVVDKPAKLATGSYYMLFSDLAEIDKAITNMSAEINVAKELKTKQLLKIKE